VSWVHSRVKVSPSGEMKEAVIKNGEVSSVWRNPSKGALKVMELRKGSYYRTVEGSDYFYVIYQVPKKAKKLKGEKLGGVTYL
jgi:hypothetical protein